MKSIFSICNTIFLSTKIINTLSTKKISNKRPLLTVASLSCLHAFILGYADPAFSSMSVTPNENLEQLIKTRSCRGCNLSGLSLNRLDLSGVDLEGADLSFSKLHLTNLSGANLKNTKLKGAAFGGADLGEADLRGAELQDTLLDNAYLGDALLDPELVTSLEIKPVHSQANPSPGSQNSGIETINESEDTSSVGWWASQPKSNKMLYTNLTAAAAIGLWGLTTWDYGSADFTMGNEGWFGHDTKYGGADKFGHLWSTYAFSDALTGLYKSWGYEPKKANTYAALSSWSVQLFMELGDATSETQGFSWEDMAMNTLGALTSVLMERYPELDRKIDLRIEYVFDEPVEGIFDDYSNQFYSIVLKLDGFDAIENTFAKYIEFSGGYYTRGYGDPDKEDTRSLFIGIGFNFSRLLDQNGWKKTGKILEYVQIPYSVPKVSYDFD